MSRSYRAPIFTEGYGGRDRKRRKRQANRKVRDEAEVPSGNSFKKVHETWDICDWKFYSPESGYKVRRK